MGTVLGVRAADGVALAADRRATSGGTVRSESLEKLLEYDAAGAAVAGDPDGIQAFGRELDAAVRRRETERDSAIRIDPLSRLATDLASEAGVEAIVAARDGNRVARLRAIDGSGGALEETAVARGTGVEFALGQLDGMDQEVSVEEAAEVLGSILERVAERDTETGGDREVWTLADG